MCRRCPRWTITNAKKKQAMTTWMVIRSLTLKKSKGTSATRQLAISARCTHHRERDRVSLAG